MSMTSRERVLAAINHREPDRVPIILGTSNTTGMKGNVYRNLKKYLGIEAGERYIYDWPELGTALLDEQTLQRLHSDARGVLDLYPSWVYERNQSRPPHDPFIDDWGTGQKEVQPGLWYPGIHPMAGATTIEEIEAYPWPDMDDPSRVAHVREQARNLAESNQYAIIGTPWLLFPFERAHAMQGLDVFLYNMAANPEFAKALLEKIAELCKILMGHFLDEIGDNIDIIKIGDDLGTQESLMISPRMYRQLLKPIHADFISFIKSKTKAKVFFHTDGDVFNLIDDFVEIGVDILNPIQTSAGKMSNLEALKERWGDQLAFCGAVDTHHILPFGTPQEVRDEVQRVLKIMAPGGGYMLSSVHTIMDEVPPENIMAMVEAVLEFSG
ncbi:MAG: uroporphyrinogen decarboxylase family protein [Anaerolineales bacterium]